jgi:transketolase
LSQGHNLDMVFMATAADIETRNNGATHMGNDDALAFGSMAHLKIINISCPHQLIAAMRWVMEGNRGLVYLRVMRYASPVLYGPDTVFEYGKAYPLKSGIADRAVIISSGRGVHEALAASSLLARSGIAVGVVDMPSIDEKFLMGLYASSRPVLVAEQNNGYIWSAFSRLLVRSGQVIDTSRLKAINTLDKDGLPQFIHSGTYPQLAGQLGLTAADIVQKVKEMLSH